MYVDVDQLQLATPRRGLTAYGVLSRGDDIVPVIGARKRGQLDEALGAVAVKLSAAEVARMQSIARPEDVAGTRYDAQQMRMLDSERIEASMKRLGRHEFLPRHTYVCASN